MDEKCACHFKYPDGTKVAIKDKKAREEIEDLKIDVASTQIQLENYSCFKETKLYARDFNSFDEFKNGGWFRIAKIKRAPALTFPTSAIFKLLYRFSNGAFWNNIIFSVTTLHDKEPSVTILNHTSGMYEKDIPKIRVYYDYDETWLDIFVTNKDIVIEQDDFIFTHVEIISNSFNSNELTCKWELENTRLVSMNGGYEFPTKESHKRYLHTIFLKIKNGYHEIDVVGTCITNSNIILQNEIPNYIREGIIVLQGGNVFFNAGSTNVRYVISNWKNDKYSFVVSPGDIYNYQLGYDSNNQVIGYTIQNFEYKTHVI